jgi:hypothetical protein
VGGGHDQHIREGFPPPFSPSFWDGVGFLLNVGPCARSWARKRPNTTRVCGAGPGTLTDLNRGSAGARLGTWAALCREHAGGGVRPHWPTGSVWVGRYFGCFRFSLVLLDILDLRFF